MATIPPPPPPPPPPPGAVAPATAPAEHRATVGAATTTQARKTRYKSSHPQKCCFNDLGGPWPRNIILQAATCPDIKKKLMTLVVGREEVHFTWFREVLSFHSPFFAGAVKYAWSSESEDGIVRMPEVSPDVVREFIRWITDHRVGGYGAGSDNPSLSPWNYWDLMIDLFIFGNKYNIPRIQNVAINEMIALFRHQFAFPRACAIEKIYTQTPQDVPVRRLVTDMVVLSHENIEGLINGQASFGDGLHPEFIQDLLKRLYRAANHEDGYPSQRLTREQWGVIHRCRYHVSEVDAHSNGKKILKRSHAESLP